MTCESIMIADPPHLTADTPLGEAMEALFCHRVFALPVVDRDGRFAGLFDVHQMLKLLLPKAVTLELGLTDLSYVHDSGDPWRELRGHLDRIGNEPIAGYLTTDTPIVRPGTAVLETLNRLYHRPGLVPVVTAEGRLVGIVTCWDAFRKVATLSCAAPE